MSQLGRPQSDLLWLPQSEKQYGNTGAMFRGQGDFFFCFPQHLSAASTWRSLEPARRGGWASQARVCEGCGGHSVAVYHIWMLRQEAPPRGERALSFGPSLSTFDSALRNPLTSPSSSLLGRDQKDTDSVSSSREMGRKEGPG